MGTPRLSFCKAAPVDVSPLQCLLGRGHKQGSHPGPGHGNLDPVSCLTGVWVLTSTPPGITMERTGWSARARCPAQAQESAKRFTSEDPPPHWAQWVGSQTKMGCFAHTRWSEAARLRRERDAEQLPPAVRTGREVARHRPGSPRLETSPESGGAGLAPAFVYAPWHLDPWTWSVALQTSPRPRSAGWPPDSWLGKAWFSVAGFSSRTWDCREACPRASQAHRQRQWPRPVWRGPVVSTSTTW